MKRLNKFLSESGVIGRRKADVAISDGRVSVNAKPASLGQLIDPKNDVITFEGKLVVPVWDFVYYALHKPSGVVSTASDELGRTTVLDLVPGQPRVFPVGRLDRETLGLIILTNDGDFAQLLAHPSHVHEKEYRLTLRQRSSVNIGAGKRIKEQFERGLLIDGKLMKADKVKIIPVPNSHFLCFDITLHSGYNRQLRKMSAKIGMEVYRLVRFRIGKLSIDDLSIKPGEYKEISKSDIL